MIKKINNNAYFIMDYTSFCTSIQQYDPVLANQILLTQDMEYDINIIREPEKTPIEELK